MSTPAPARLAALTVRRVDGKPCDRFDRDRIRQLVSGQVDGARVIVGHIIDMPPRTVAVTAWVDLSAVELPWPYGIVQNGAGQ